MTRQVRPCCGAHVDSNDPCCTFREDELNAKMYAGWWAEATKERDEARRELAAARLEIERLGKDQDMTITLACAEAEGRVQQHKANEIQMAKERNEARAEVDRLKEGARLALEMLEQGDGVGVIHLRWVLEGQPTPHDGTGRPLA